jgi:sarcosine oxidase subunit gamma
MKSQSLQIDEYKYRSFVYRKFVNLNATWAEINGYAAVLKIKDLKSELESAQKLALCDLSYIQRIGFKGSSAPDWLLEQKIVIPHDINSARLVNNDYLVARLGAYDILILGHIENKTNIKQKLEQKWCEDYSSDNNCGYIMPKQDSHACFYVCGAHASEMFSTLCAVDLRTNKFENLMIAQTFLAKITATIIRYDIGSTPGYYVLVENVSSEYCWDAIYDAMQEFKGQVIGLSCLIDLMS